MQVTGENLHDWSELPPANEFLFCPARKTQDIGETKALLL